MKLAVIKTGGKQYLVQEGTVLKVEKLDHKSGDNIDFDQVLLTSTGKTSKIGTPLVEGATVTAEVVEHGRHKKVVGVKMKAKKRYRRRFGHKQHFTAVKITGIKTR